ncbi:MAG: UDP-3-O-(3-hydroxymyristoyl)glucosamine N-acyltransferase, partial [Deltaproteobacteria bacterium]|nr:UDP-3-O-(3-hydroxymyristoyl)glucosamine N-acyltransferase [Deltaproteobacteria bacterium]
MAKTRPQARSWSLGELAEVVGGAVRGDPTLTITGVASLAEAQPGELAFYNNPRYRAALASTRACAVLIHEASADLVRGPAALVVADPYLSFARISAVVHPRPQPEAGIDARAVVEPGAQIDPSATVMALCFIAEGARVGPRAVLYPQVFL